VFLLFLLFLNFKKIICAGICLVIILLSAFGIFMSINSNQSIAVVEDVNGKKYIKWVSFNVTYPALKKAMDLDISSHNKDGYKYNWIEILSYLGAKYGGIFTKYKESDMNALIKRLEAGEKMEDITKDMKFYSYYLEAYTAVLAEFVGNYRIQVSDKQGNIQWQEKYGLKVFSPIAMGYYYNDYDDFGSRKRFWI
jgi:hypothetical protein